MEQRFNSSIFRNGGLAEPGIALVLKTMAASKGHGSSNLSSSAKVCVSEREGVGLQNRSHWFESSRRLPRGMGESASHRSAKPRLPRDGYAGSNPAPSAMRP